MVCAVYRTRNLGERRDREAIRRDRNIGDLIYGVRVYDPQPQWRVMKAQLIGPDGVNYVVPMLDQARLLRVRGNGLLIGGREIIVLSRGAKNIKSAQYSQAWWCVPLELVSDAAAAAGAGAGKVREQLVAQLKTDASRPS